MKELPETEPNFQAAFLALGSNIRPERFIPLAIEELSKRFNITGVSSVWQSPADGFIGADFLNAVVKISTDMTPVSLKYRALRPIEAQLGRVRTEHKYSPRTIDIDILILGEKILDNEIWQQPHLAVPLAELVPDLRHPESGKLLTEIAGSLRASTTIHQRPISQS